LIKSVSNKRKERTTGETILVDGIVPFISSSCVFYGLFSSQPAIQCLLKVHATHLDLTCGRREAGEALGVHERGGDEKNPAAVRDLLLDNRGRIEYQKLASTYLIWLSFFRFDAQKLIRCV
jgi:hypothetical protein